MPAGMQPFIPSQTLADWSNANGVLTAVSCSEHVVQATLGGAAASRDAPTTGACIVQPIRNMRGRQITLTAHAALALPMLKFDTGTWLPADALCGLLFINAATIASATAGVGVIAVGNGTGLTQGRVAYTAGWVLGNAGVYDALGRAVTQGKRLATATSGQSSTVLVDANSDILGSPFADGTNRTQGPMTHVALYFGWLTGAGVNGSIARVKPYYAAGNALALPGVL
jgi:hypothetical protein